MCREMKWDHVIVIYDSSIEGLVSYDSFVNAAFEHLVCSELDIQLEAFPFQMVPIDYDTLRDGLFNRTTEGDFRWLTSVYNDIDLKIRPLLLKQTKSNGVFNFISRYAKLVMI